MALTDSTDVDEHHRSETPTRMLHRTDIAQHVCFSRGFIVNVSNSRRRRRDGSADIFFSIFTTIIIMIIIMIIIIIISSSSSIQGLKRTLFNGTRQYNIQIFDRGIFLK